MKQEAWKIKAHIVLLVVEKNQVEEVRVRELIKKLVMEVKPKESPVMNKKRLTSK